MLARILDFLCGGPAARRRRLIAALEPVRHPAALTGIDGRVRWANAAMRRQSGPAGGDVAGYLAGEVVADAGLIYRLATGARAHGFAFAPAGSPDAEVPRILAARSHAPDLLIWTLVPVEAILTADSGARFDPDPNPARSLPPPPDPSAPARRQADRGDLPPSDPAPATPARETGSAAAARSALEAVPVALMQLDLAGTLLWCNALAREMIGRTPVPGTPLASLVEPLGRPVETFVAEAGADPGGRREMVRLRGAGPDVFLHVVLTPVIFGSDPILVAVLSDASELRSLEDRFAQSQKMEAIGKLAGGVAHDFNNVLTAISGHSDLLLLGKDALHPDYSDLMQIRQNTHRAAALVRQLLAFSRKQTLTPTLLSVQDVVSDSLYLLNRLIGEKVTLTVEHGADIGYIRADQQQFEQALMNLVVNARDAMANGGVVTIATRVVTIGAGTPIQGIGVPAGTYAEISVADDGTGIDPHIIDRVFEPFFTTKPQGEGTGLGLPTVYGIVKQSGGFVFAENRPGGGACFRILLPHASASAAAEVPATPPAEPHRPDLTGRGTVLLVEDEDPVRSFASRALRLRGYDVIEAASAEAALEIIDGTGTRIDVLVSDVVMPGMDGPTFAAQARRMRPGLRVVFISGYAEDSFRRNLVDHDFQFLPKPFSLTDLTAKVKEALGGRD